MKRLLTAIAILLLPVLAMADPADRDLLLTNGGTFFAVESVFAQDAPAYVQTRSTRILTLTTQNGTTSTTSVIPASLGGGWHVNPALAYDEETKTLFVFWAYNGGLNSSLQFCTFRDGRWSPATTLDNADWDLRHNLRIALTRRIESIDNEGKSAIVPEITVHAVWWQENGYAEWARYAMLTVDKGNVTSFSVANLGEYLNEKSDPTRMVAGKNNDILRFPAIFEAATRDSVDVVFGDPATDKLHRVNLKPVLKPADKGRVRITIPRHDHSIEVPSEFTLSAGLPVSALSSGRDNLVYYYGTGEALNYVAYREGKWSTGRSISLNERVSHDQAVEAVRKMVNAQ